MTTKWSLQILVNILVVNFGLFFQTTCVLLGQILSLPLYYFGPRHIYLQYITYVLELWSQTLVAVIQYFAPSSMVITMDDSCLRDSNDINSPSATLDTLIQRNNNGTITKLVFPERIIVTINHQTYADWAYVWCIALLAKAHGVMKIILKDSLRNLPVYGLAMDFCEFIFMSRKLATDQHTIVDNLTRSKEDKRPLWLLVCPEGTIISENTRKKSKDYAEKNDVKDTRHALLPRSSGLRICMQSLGDSVDWLYDFTIGYSDIRPGDYPEDIYTIPNIFFFNKQPKKLHVHIRRFHIKDIPYNNETEFSNWMYQRWYEKDDLLAYFYREGHFPENHQHAIQDLDIAATKATPSEKTINPNTFTVPIEQSDVWKMAIPASFLLPYLPLLFATWTLGKYLYSYI
ncbi:unnamed protein product [Absidia cylindrospora]